MSSETRRYLLSIYQPDGSPPPDIDRISREVGAIRDEMQATGAWVFSAGLFPPSTATVIRSKDGEVLITDGPYVEAKEHLGGFTIVSVPDLDAALEWGRRIAEATTLPIEVRPFQGDVPHEP
jgi:hypothetical protein